MIIVICTELTSHLNHSESYTPQSYSLQIKINDIGRHGGISLNAILHNPGRKATGGRAPRGVHTSVAAAAAAKTPSARP